MAQATLNLSVVPKRMLTMAEAASHCGRPIKRFEIEYPGPTVQFPNGDLRYDVHDLDRWLDQMKTGQTALNADSIVAKLV